MLLFLLLSWVMGYGLWVASFFGAFALRWHNSRIAFALGYDAFAYAIHAFAYEKMAKFTTFNEYLTEMGK